jgi:AhpD family alkylhydroperoxidase
MSRLPYTKLAPGGYSALASLGHYISTETALEPVLLELVYLRASQLNGCGFCIGMHTAELHKHNEPDSRIDAVADWRGSDAFTPRERAALAWAEAVTDVNASHVSDDDYAAVKEFFEDKDLVDLTFAIANINAWNRLGVAFRAEWKPKTRVVSGEIAAHAAPAVSEETAAE